MSFTVYKSSAGSGKTFTLVKEYLCMVLQKPTSFRNILAITFTNKAANELKERVLTYLRELSAANPQSSSVKKFMLPLLIDETGLDVATIKERAGTTLSLILHNYSDFAIGTIDSFVHRIIKTFAYDLRLPLGFDVEMDEDEHLNRAIDILINRIGIDQDLTSILVNFTKLKTTEEVDWQIEKDLLKFSKTLIDEDGRDAIEKLKNLNRADFQEIAKTTSTFIKEFKKEIEQIAEKAVLLIHSKNISDDVFSRGRSGISVYFKRLAKKNNEDFTSNTFVTTTINDDKWVANKADEQEIAAINSIKDDLKSFYQQIQHVLEKKQEKYHLYRIIHKQVYAVAVLGEIGKILEEQKHTNNIIHISEFNKRVADIVFNEPIPFIYERLGERYKSFLIDEFQDTSVLQWQNFIPLVDNSLAEGHFNMIVGDGKQAIYRFRNGEVEQFARLPELFEAKNLPLAKEREDSLKRNYVEKKLKHNFRSKKEIIEFNNAFFKCVSGCLVDDYQNIYEGLEQAFDEKNTGGYVHIDLLKSDKEETWMDLNLNRVKKIIDEQIADGFTYKEITVLCRSNSEITTVANFLLESAYPIITSESLVLGGSPEVNLIITVLQYLTNTTERVYQAGIIRYLVETRHLSEDFATALELTKPLTIEDGSEEEQTDVFKGFLETNKISLNQAYLLSLPIYDLIEELIRIFKLDKNVNPFVQFFLDAVMNCNSKEQTDIFGFLEWWERNQSKESVVVPEELNAIRILSIHKSKGLEFPVVIYPFANNNLKTTKSNAWIQLQDESLPKLKLFYLPLTDSATKGTAYADVFSEEKNKSLLDLVNMLYVAFTRPTHRLYVISESIGNRTSSGENISRLIQFFLEQNGNFEPDKMAYEFGQRKLQEKEVLDDANDSIALGSFISENWREKLLISTNAPEIWDVHDPEKNKDWGNLIHLVLSKIQSKNEVGKVVSQFEESGIIRSDDVSEIIDALNKLMNNVLAGKFFEEGLKVKNEAEILLEDGRILRPDRLIFGENELTIIDYKTGKPETKHESQIISYAKTLTKMGYKNIRKYLIYIDKDVEVLEVN